MLAATMQLRPAEAAIRQGRIFAEEHTRRLKDSDAVFGWEASPFTTQGDAVCVLKRTKNMHACFAQLMQLTHVPCLDVQNRGGFLLHGALAVYHGDGVVFVGASGSGKTTISQQLIPPWQSLCDDVTLVVREPQGTYWAHPWPTWSRFQNGGSGGTWNAQQAVPLKGIFFLARGQRTQITPVGIGQAVCLLTASTAQVSAGIVRNISKEQGDMVRLQSFGNVCAFAQKVPGHLLHLSPSQIMWQDIEKVLVCIHTFD